ncbi:sodium:solute symporter [Ornithobacterium rhinotracheale]|uniref:sodium:solute symporter n=1 Tax=Ornithobacterium rhinotracheale TaxID=28251 RepID=UPI004036A943
MLTPWLTAALIAGYFCVLLFVSYLTSRKSTSETFFTGNHQSPWFVVAYGMIGAALSAVTFVSIPGGVVNNAFYLSQFFLGNLVGYLFITFVLIPIYYQLRLVSIYSYLHNRFGWFSYKTGSFFFLLSQSFGAGLRLLLAIKILQVLFGLGNEHAWWLGLLFLILIFLYTFKAGIKTIVWTDLLQTTFLILAALSIVFVIFSKLQMGLGDMIAMGEEKGYWRWLNTDVNSGSYFWKQFLSGILIAMAMNGLDQNIMQKSLTCKNMREAQKNTLVFSFSVAVVQCLFLFLGMMLYLYADVYQIELPTKMVNDVSQIATDKVLPFLTLNHFGLLAGVMFVLGTAAAAFSSVDSALTALTTSFCYDFLGIEKKKNPIQLKTITHIGFSVVMLGLILIFQNSGSDVFSLIFSLAGYTYSPLLGLFLLGIFTSFKPNDKIVPVACISTPVLAYFLNQFLLKNYDFNMGFLTILTGAIISIVLLYVLNAVSKLVK